MPLRRPLQSSRPLEVLPRRLALSLLLCLDRLLLRIMVRRKRGQAEEEEEKENEEEEETDIDINYRAVNKKCPGKRHIVEPRGFF